MSLTLSPENGIDLNGVDIQDTALANAQANDRGFKNLIINGDFRIAQRGTSFGYENGYKLDRWLFNSYAGGSNDCAQDTDTPNSLFRNSIKITATANMSDYYFYQKIEGFKQLSGQTVTFSFWGKASQNINGMQIHWSASPNQGTDAHFMTDVETYNLTTSWQKYVFTINLPELSEAEGANPSFNIFNGIRQTYTTPEKGVDIPSGASVWFTGAQLEVGDVATPFEHRPYGLELALCQRYYTIAYKNTPYYPGFVFNNSQVGAQGLKFPVTMRVAPAITAINPYHITTAGNWGIYGATNGWSSTGYTPNFSSISSDQVVPQFSGVSGVTNNYTYICSGGFIADAEL
jgi:hypothetical protein